MAYPLQLHVIQDKTKEQSFVSKMLKKRENNNPHTKLMPNIEGEKAKHPGQGISTVHRTDGYWLQEDIKTMNNNTNYLKTNTNRQRKLE